MDVDRFLTCNSSIEQIVSVASNDTEGCCCVFMAVIYALIFTIIQIER